MPETDQSDPAPSAGRVGILGGGQLAMLLCAEAEPSWPDHHGARTL